MKRMRLSLIAVCVAGAWVAGCVAPGDVEPTTLYRYHKKLAMRIGAYRKGDEGMDVYRPARRGAIPELPVRVVTRRVVDHPTITRLADANASLDDDPAVGAFDANQMYRQVEVPEIPLSLEQAIVRALAGNTEVQISGYDPAISRQDMVKAAAEFDPVLFGTWSYDKIDRQGATLGEQTNRGIEAGVRQKLITGGTWSTSFAYARNFDDVNGSRWEPEVSFQFTQPLLRNAWGGFNLARLRIARISHEASLAGFRDTVEDVVTRAAAAYWTLQQAQTETLIVQELLEETLRTHRKTVLRPKARENIERKQTRSAVVSRQLELLRAEKALADARDNLRKILADPQINLRSDAVIHATTPPDPTPVVIDPADQLLTALRHNPVMKQARLAIQVSAINIDVAKNQLLPKVDLSVGTTLHGRDRGRNDATDNLLTGNYASYSLALTAEYPIGNRARLADLYARRFEYAQSVTQMQDTADQLAQLIQERIREIETTHHEWQQRSREVKMLELLVQGFETLVREVAMTPNNLQLLLDAQGRLATARRAQARALVGYQNAQLDLARETGTALKLPRMKIALPAAADQASWPEMPADGNE